VSDKALACPFCGYPINTPVAPVIVTPPVKKRHKKFRRLPNGFGSIKHLSGKRRNPYAAYPPTKEWNGKNPKARPAIGYFPTYNEAYKALAEYNRQGIDIENKIVTFTQIYDLFLENYKKKEPSKSALNSYDQAYKKCKSLHDAQFAMLRREDYQVIFDECSDYSISTANSIRTLLNQMYKTAIGKDVVDRNYATGVIIKGKDIEQGVPFTEKELRILWKHRDDVRVQPALIMIFCGHRIGELPLIEISDGVIIGGLKTKAGKNRVVPINSAVLPFIDSIKGINKNTYPLKFQELLDELGIGYTETGEKHTCHDCRHTFSWLCDKFKVDKLAKKMLIGHALGKDVTDNVYGHRTLEELKVEIEKIKPPILSNKSD
jgi:integrase